MSEKLDDAKQAVLDMLDALAEFTDAFNNYIMSECNGHKNLIDQGKESAIDAAGEWLTESLEHITEMQVMVTNAAMALHAYQTEAQGDPDVIPITKKLIVP